jgi:hypothetical protein
MRTLFRELKKDSPHILAELFKNQEKEDLHYGDPLSKMLTN